VQRARRWNSIRSSPQTGAKHAKRRVGRGIGSGLGKTAGRGHKGQKSPCRRLPQGRLRRRSDASAASPAQARLQVAPAEVQRRDHACRDLQGSGRLTESRRAGRLKAVPVWCRSAAPRSVEGASSAGELYAKAHRRLEGHRRVTAGCARPPSKRPAARSLLTESAHDATTGPSVATNRRTSWPRAASSATCVAD